MSCACGVTQNATHCVSARRCENCGSTYWTCYNCHVQIIDYLLNFYEIGYWV